MAEAAKRGWHQEAHISPYAETQVSPRMSRKQANDLRTIQVLLGHSEARTFTTVSFAHFSAAPPASDSQSAQKHRSVTARRSKTIEETDEAMSRPTIEVADIIHTSAAVSGNSTAVASCLAPSQGARSPSFIAAPRHLRRSSGSVRPLRPIEAISFNSCRNLALPQNARGTRAQNG